MLVKRRSSLKNRLKILVIPIVLGGLAYLILFSGVFSITAVEVRGAGLSEEIISQYIGENIVGANILFWKPETTETPKIPIFNLHKNFFGRKIIVTAIEREKNLIWCFKKNNNCFWVDEDGIIFEAAPQTSGSLIKVVNDHSDREGEIGESALPPDFFRTLQRILGIVNKLNLRPTEISIANIKYRELEMQMPNGPKVTFSLVLDPSFTEAAINQFYSSWGKIKTLNLTVDGRAYAGF